ncbi:MAG TPA: hypothetical protein VHW69_16450 [Rhizomicrobium sp.]|jgi:hypothetical protein|nr:hypothetical protein [Rhizomicrobium sp.]
MVQESSLLKLVRPVGLTAAAAVFALTAMASLPASAKSISTLKSWDGAAYVQPFGCPDTTTYGQVITIPNNLTNLSKFSFEWINLNTGTMVVRGEVYAWDGTKATGNSLYESKPKKISFSDGVFHKVTFKPSVLPVTPGAQYVIFASTAKDYEKCTNSYQLGWGYIPNDVYSGGSFVYQNNGGDEGQWTTQPWSGFDDAAFKAALN